MLAERRAVRSWSPWNLSGPIPESSQPGFAWKNEPRKRWSVPRPFGGASMSPADDDRWSAFAPDATSGAQAQVRLTGPNPDQGVLSGVNPIHPQAARPVEMASATPGAGTSATRGAVAERSPADQPFLPPIRVNAFRRVVPIDPLPASPRPPASAAPPRLIRCPSDACGIAACSSSHSSHDHRPVRQADSYRTSPFNSGIL
jgi:hypothetical protein